jgi:hypothetical protein
VGGLAVLFVAGLYLAIGVWIVIKSPGWWRLVALLAMVLIPSADALWGRYVTLPRLCKDAGLKVYGKASKEGGLMLSTADDYWLTKYGFPFVEGVNGAGQIYRRSLRDGKSVLESNVAPRASYVNRMASSGEGTSFLSNVLTVEDRLSGSTLGSIRAYTFLGGWAEQLLARFTDAGVSGVAGCGWEVFQTERLLVAVFGLGE